MFSSRAILRATRASAPRTFAAPRVIASSQIRSYAAAPTAPDSKPPVALYGLDGTYASALVRYAFLIDGLLGCMANVRDREANEMVMNSTQQP